MSWLPDYLKNLATANYGMWDSPTPGLHPDGSITAGEGGVDIGSPTGTPVYALADGPIIASGYWQDKEHGVITQRVSVPGQGTQDLYYQHIYLDPSIQQCVGNCTQQVKRGQLIGTIGGYGEIEMGFNAQWGTVWGGTHPGPWIRDPRPWLEALLSGNGAAPTTGTLSASTPATDPFSALMTMLSPLTPWLSDPLRIVKLVVGALVVGLAFYMLGTGETNPASAVRGLAKKVSV